MESGNLGGWCKEPCCLVWVVGGDGTTTLPSTNADTSSGVRVLPNPNGFNRYRQAVALEVEQRVARAHAQSIKRRGGLKERAAGRVAKKK